MKIKSIEIYGFGKWIDKKIENIEQVQLFYGENEAGKTTLMAFIHSILFGFPSKQNSDLRYEPKTTSQYGGKLLIEDDLYGEISIERIKGKANGKVTVTLPSGETGSDKLLEKLVYGIDKTTYQALFSFNLFGIQKIQRMNKAKLNRYFLSVGSLGNEHLLKLADKFQTEAGKLYKQTGRVPEINKKIREVENKKQQLRIAKGKNNQYTHIYSEKEKYEQEIEKIKDARSENETHLEQLSRLAVNWNHFSEILAIQEDIRKNNIKNMPQDGLFQLNHLNQSIDQLRATMMQEKERSKQAMEKSHLTKAQSLFIERKNDIQRIVSSIDSTKSILQEKEFLEREVKKESEQVMRGKLQLGLNIGQRIPLRQTTTQKENYQNLYQSVLEKERKLKEAIEKKTFLIYQQNSLSEQLDKIEPEIWDNQLFQETEKRYQQSENQEYNRDQFLMNKKIKSKEKNKRLKTSLTGLLGVVLGISGFITEGQIGSFVALIGIAIVGVTNLLYFIKKSKKETSDKKDNDILKNTYADYIKQIELRKQWRAQLAEYDQVVMESKQTQETIEKYTNQNKELTNKLSQIIVNNGYPENMTIESLVNQEDLFDSLRERVQAVDEKEELLEKISEQLSQWKKQVQFLESVILVDWEHFPSVLSGINQFYQDSLVDEQTFLVIQKEEEARQEQMKKIVYEQRNFEKQRVVLFESVEAKNEEDFRKKFVLFDEWKRKKARLQLLEQQVSEDIKLLEQFRDQEDLLGQIEKIKKAIQLHRVSEEQLINKRIKKELALKELEKGGEYSILLQEYANLKSELQELVDKWSTYKVAAELIERAMTHARKNRFPETIQDTTKFFELLTKGQYKKVLLKEEKIEVQRQDGAIFDTSELSQGTAEQLYVALRFAFVKNANDIVPLPIMIDDGFVNFDQSRRLQMIELIQQMSKTTQVFYFTFDQQFLTKFRKEQIEML
ncbi:ATP-binding protein [Carnobacterium funditum]|uniref:ATP-binding protein n=1 Tax=Carnobacterium funditum TaxID=2752 RepID=UPI00054EFCB1|nr:AAA family ATPase [Carnobacterium funditum]